MDLYDLSDLWTAELVTARGLRYASRDYDAILEAETVSEVFTDTGSRTSLSMTAWVRPSDFTTGHPAERATVTARGRTWRIASRTMDQEGHLYRLSLVDAYGPTQG